MKKLLMCTILTFICSNVQAGLIAHSDYVSGTVITSAGQNANENKIYNEFNGNIDNTNIKSGGIIATNLANATITTTQIAANTIQDTNMTTVLQSSFTQWNAYASYRRPHVVWISTATIGVEGNTSVTNQTCVVFPDANYRCITEPFTTHQFRSAIYTNTASLSNPYAAGIAVGDTLNTNTWRYAYMVKTVDISTATVLVLSSTSPVQSNATTLNSAFGINGWVYIGAIHYGDNGSNAVGFLQFYQIGNFTKFINTGTGGNACTANGIILTTTAGASSLTYTKTGSAGNLTPDGAVSYLITTAGCVNVSTALRITNGGSADLYRLASLGSSANLVATVTVGMSSGDSIIVAGSGSVATDIWMTGFYDNILGIGMNPQL